MAVAAAGAFLASNATAIMTATAVGSSIMQGVEARNQAKAAKAQQKHQNKSAIENMQHQYGVLNENERDSLLRSREESMDIQGEFAKRRSQLNLMSAASGTAGLSVDNMITGLERDRGRNMEAVLRNQDTELSNFREQAESIRAGTAGRMDTRRIQRPSWLEVGLNTASQAGQAYIQGQAIQAELGQTGNASATLGGSGRSSGGIYDNIRGGV